MPLRTADATCKSVRDDLIDRLEIRRMESSDYRARWCVCCLRTELRNPFVMLHAGDGGKCRQPMRTGTISECITDFICLAEAV